MGYGVGGLTYRNRLGVTQELSRNCKDFLNLDTSNPLITKNRMILDAIDVIRAPFTSGSKDFNALSQALAKDETSFNPLAWFKPTWSSILKDENILNTQICSDKLKKIYEYQISKETPFQSVFSVRNIFPITATDLDGVVHESIPLIPIVLPESVIKEKTLTSLGVLLNSTEPTQVLYKDASTGSNLFPSSLKETPEILSSASSSILEGFSIKNLLIGSLALACISIISVAVYRALSKVEDKGPEEKDSTDKFNNYWTSIQALESKKSNSYMMYVKRGYGIINS